MSVKSLMQKINQKVGEKVGIKFDNLRQAEKSKSYIKAAFVGLVYTLSLTGVFGQDAQHTENKADQTLRGSGRVNSSTLATEIDVPLSAYPGRGINIPVGLSYSSKVWRMEFLTNSPLPVGDGGENRCIATYEAKFGENSASGWTTSMQEAFVEYTGSDNLFNGEGFPIGPGIECIPALYENNNNASYVRRIQVHLPSGESHELRMDDQPKVYDRSSNCGFPPAPCNLNQASLDSNWSGWYKAVDGSNLKYYEDRANNVYFLQLPDGSRYDFATGRVDIGSQTSPRNVRKATRYTDRNGNFITYHEPDSTYLNGYWTDTMGKPLGVPLPRTAPTSAGIKNYNLPGLNGNAMIYKFHWKKLKDATAAESALTDFSQNLKYPGDWTARPDTNMGTHRAAAVCLFHSGWSDWVVHDSGEPPFNPILLTGIELPGGQMYRFSYNVYGEIDRVFYPTGGEEQFTYAEMPSLTYAGQQPNSVKESNRGVLNRKVYTEAGTGMPAEWTYSVQYADREGYKTNVVNPDGTRAEKYLHRGKPSCNGCPGDWGYDNGLAGMAYEERLFSSTGSLLSRTLRRWEITILTGAFPTATVAPWHPRVTWEKNITYDASGNGLASVSINEYEGDLTQANPNVRDTPVLAKKSTAYDYETVSDGTSFTPGQAPVWNPAPVATPVPPTALRSSETTYLINDTVNYPDPNVREAYKNRNIIGLVTMTKVKDGSGNTKAQTQISYDEGGNYELISEGTHAQWDDPETSYRGNATTTKSWTDIANNLSVQTHARFDNFGNLRKGWDAKGNMSEVQYSSTYQYAYPTKSISPPPVNSGQNGSTASLTTTTAYDATTGLPTSSTDANEQTTQMSYIDPATNAVDKLLRLRKVTAPNGHQTKTDYGTPDSVTGVFSVNERFVKVSAQIDDVKWKISFSGFDGLGRTTISQTVDSNGDVFTETQYDNMGRVKKATNPFRTGETPLWTESVYDELGRVTKIKTPDNAEVITAYSLATGTTVGMVVTVTDQAGKQRRSVTNALGQLGRVDEPTDANGLGTIDAANQSTSYVYDTLNNLVTVNQGSQTRSFVYDSLSRLKTATNPESGAINYSYDANGNLLTKIDARNVATTFTYDNLNRVQTRGYSDGTTPAVTYFHDLLANAKGKLIKSSSSVSTTEYTSFDTMGRVTAHKQTTDGNIYTTGYSYNLSGALMEETYPSTRVVKNVLDNDGDLSMVQSKQNGNTGFYNYAKNMTFTAAGAVSSMQLGNGKWESTTFNSRLQPMQIALGTVQNGFDKLKLNYSYGGTDNNGNVQSQTITVPTVGANPGFTATQAYTYDAVNRLKSATENIGATQSWKQTFTFDRYGNRNFDTTNNNTTTLGACPTAQCNPTISATNNRFTSGQGYTYDFAGNVITDAQGRTFAFDAENKQKEVRDVNNIVIGTYFYDGDGKRVKKVSNTETVIFVYDALGKLVAEYENQTPVNPQVSYLTNDTLGSPRITTDANGNVISRRDFMPFGEEIYTAQRTQGLGYSADNVKQKFTSYERDIESELDFADARYYNFNHGRFTSVDPLLSTGEPSDPQTWHRYAYALNNPLFYTDPTGMYVCKGNKEQCEQFTTRLGEAKANLEKIKTTYGEKSKEYKKAAASVNSYGNDETGKKKNNGVIVTFDKKGDGGRTTGTFADNGKGKLIGNVTVHFNKDALDDDASQALVAHEGSHVDDYKTVGQRSEFAEEFDAHTVQSIFLEAQGAERGGYSNKPENKYYPFWEPSWEGPDKATLRSNAIKDWLAVPTAKGGYGLTPPKPKPPRATPKRRRN